MPTITTNFTARDYTAIYEWLLNILREECPEYTDLNHSDAGIALIRLIARISDSLSLYLDMAFAESFIASAKFKQSLIDIARTVDLLPKLPNAATSVLRITRTNPLLGNVSIDGVMTRRIFIPKYTQVTSYDGIIYLIMSDVTILENETYKDVAIVQGTHEVLTLSRSDFFYDSKTGRYLYNLGINIADGYFSMTENDVVTWEEVDSLWRSFSTDPHYFLEVYADKYNGVADTIFLTIGNGTQGQALSQGSSYELDYIKCDAAAGNVAVNLITNISSDFTPFVTISNIVGASGGAGVEPIEDFRLRVPKMVRTQRRAVTKEDYEALILSVPGIKRVQAIDRNDEGIYPWEYVAIFVSPEGGGNLTSELYAKVMDTCTINGALGGWYRRYIISAAVLDPIDISCSVGVSYGFDPTSVISSVTATITSFFHVDNNDIHKLFVIGDLHSAVMAVSGVSWVEFPGLAYEYQPDNGHITSLGILSVTQAA
jgi:hypothetical protein